METLLLVVVEEAKGAASAKAYWYEKSLHLLLLYLTKLMHHQTYTCKGKKFEEKKHFRSKIGQNHKKVIAN